MVDRDVAWQDQPEHKHHLRRAAAGAQAIEQGLHVVCTSEG